VDTGPKADDPRLPVQTLAERAAPILWFSPDEPLRQPGSENRNIPEALPGDAPVTYPLVYYRVSRIIDDKIKTESENNAFDIDTRELALKTLDEVTVRYYFYYREDKGFHGHRNDLESLRLDIGFTPLDASGRKPKGGATAKYYVAHIKTAVGAAHGVSWYSNQLDIGKDERDVSLPLTILVEEGKHAVSPDRNADGFYSPGYDVNRRYNDARPLRMLALGAVGDRFEQRARSSRQIA
jgi:hypothetical protein